MAIIGISGKKQAGKDTIGKIIQYLVSKSKGSYVKLTDTFDSEWQIKWFAEPLKDIVCLLIGCTRKQLEDNDFKETPLGEEWQVYRIYSPRLKKYFKEISLDKVEANDIIKNKYRQVEDNLEVHLGETTPRLLLQLIGTDCGRQIIHPNIWVNALMSKYKPTENWENSDIRENSFFIPKKEIPDWIITDVRFPNEVKAIKDRGGVIIRVNRITPEMSSYKDKNGSTIIAPVNNGKIDLHESETALDNYKDFDFIVNNDRDIEGLIDQVRVILKTLKII
jgi:hypothetical protein